jgi:gluconokinase
MQHIIGVDIGTSGTKAIVFSLSGQVLDRTYESYPIISERSGENELDPERLLGAVVNTLGLAVERLGEPNDLVGVCFSSAMHSLVAVDKNGNPLTRVLTWADLRSKSEASRISHSEAGDRIYEHTGTPIHPMSPFCKIAWMRHNWPEVFTRAHKFISIKEFIWFRFFEKYQIDYSIASATGLFDIYRLQWFAEALQVAGISPTLLSEPVSPKHIETSLREPYRSRLKLPREVPFIIGANDGCLANLGTRSISPGDMALTIGTSGAVRMASQAPRPDPQKRIFHYLLTEKLFISGGAVNNGGNAVKWFVDNFMQKDAGTSTDFAALVQEAWSIEPGCGGVIFLPYLLGERAPIWDAGARAVFFGIQSSHNAKHFLRAVLEGICFGLYQIGLSVQQHVGRTERVYASGGFIQSSGWLQMAADVFDRPVCVTSDADASSIGAALLGFWALGILSSLEESARLVEITQTYQPNQKNHAIYSKNFSVYAGLYDKLKDDFEKFTTQ